MLCSSLLGAHRVPLLLPPPGAPQNLPVSPTPHHYNFPQPNVPSCHKAPHVSLSTRIPPCPSPHITVTPRVPPSPPQAPCTPIPVTIRILQCSLIITMHPPVPVIIIAIPYHLVGVLGADVPMSPQKSVKEGLLLKQTSSFQRWKRRYFKLRGRTLYYAKDAKVGRGGSEPPLSWVWVCSSTEPCFVPTVPDL